MFSPIRSLVCYFGILFSPAFVFGAADKNWATYQGDSGSNQYSILDQINRSNAHQLEVAWVWNGGDAAENNRSQIQCNPLIIDGVFYGTSPELKLVALDAATGKELWRFDPYTHDASLAKSGTNRGLAYWRDGDDERIILQANRYIHAVNAKTGKLVSEFGTDGRVDMKKGLGRDVEGLSVISNSPVAIYQDLMYLPVRLSEGPGLAAPGHIRAYSVRTGELVWRFNTIPEPGEFGYETWMEDSYKTVGGANVWTGMTVDQERGLVFCPTGSAAFDFWGGNRLGDNLFANCLIALDANTGERVWHYQFVRHDVWDRDLPAPPNLVTIRRDGVEIPAIAQITKSGHVFVFNRETGESLYPIEESPVPFSDLAGEVVAPSQPLPTKPAPFSRQQFSADQITDISPKSHRAVMNKFVTLRPHMPWVPPSKEGTIIFPGFDGGGEWGGAAVDPDGIMYVNGNEMPWVLTMVDVTQASSAGEQLYLRNCAGCHGVDRKGAVAQVIPPLVDIQTRLKPEEIVDRIQNGKGVMPSFGFLSDKHRNQIIEYITSEPRGDEGPRDAHEDRSESALPFAHTGYNRWFDPEGYPAVKPPWGTLNAIDLNTGEYLWTRTLGEFEELTARGIPPTGTENYGGPVVTAGGVIFIGATKDEKFRVFDSRTGEELWSAKLPAGGYATPATYEVDGRQYVVIACGGGKMGTKSGDAYVAFALPR